MGANILSLYLLLTSIIIFTCIALNKVSSRIGLPMLFAFIALGMFFGSDGIIKIQFDRFDYAEWICSIALIFIIFYGGFGTKWSEARPVAAKAIVLSTLGVVLTAGLTGLFCYLVLQLELLESFLIGSIISSTDAASVFSILRYQKLNLKYNTASLLEVESGSNDPCSYMLTVIVLSIMKGKISTGSIIYMIFAQIVFGAVLGILIGYGAFFILKKFKFAAAGFDMAFIFAVALLAYALPGILGGNGYLSTYIVGIILGNKSIKNKKSLVNFFDGLTGLMQILIFFLLGLLSFPSQMPKVLTLSLAIALFLTFVARPFAVFTILSPTKCKYNQQLLVSWAGLRGAASIVFAIMAKTRIQNMNHDIFHIVFCVVLFSLVVQGSIIPLISKWLKMINNSTNVMKTFNDYSEEVPVQFIKFKLVENHLWIDQFVSDIPLPPETLFVLLLRNKERIVPNGKTILQLNDILILSAPAFEDETNIGLSELNVTLDSNWENKTISSVWTDEDRLIIMIKRGEKTIIPNGETVLYIGDVLVIGTS